MILRRGRGRRGRASERGWGLRHANVSYGLGLGRGVPPSPLEGILQGSGLLSLAYREAVSVKY
jgi:hypothetical protein